MDMAVRVCSVSSPHSMLLRPWASAMKMMSWSCILHRQMHTRRQAGRQVQSHSAALPHLRLWLCIAQAVSVQPVAQALCPVMTVLLLLLVLLA